MSSKSNSCLSANLEATSGKTLVANSQLIRVMNLGHLGIVGRWMGFQVPVINLVLLLSPTFHGIQHPGLILSCTMVQPLPRFHGSPVLHQLPFLSFPFMANSSCRRLYSFLHSLRMKAKSTRSLTACSFSHDSSLAVLDDFFRGLILCFMAHLRASSTRCFLVGASDSSVDNSSPTHPFVHVKHIEGQVRLFTDSHKSLCHCNDNSLALVIMQPTPLTVSCTRCIQVRVPVYLHI
jgi:hypothetical protein